jgi:DNA-binding Xre family transcriptional regulator
MQLHRANTAPGCLIDRLLAREAPVVGESSTPGMLFAERDLLVVEVEFGKELAQQQGLGQGKLARKADVDIKTLARIYKNAYVEVSSVTLEKLARALSVSIADLIEEIDDDGKNEVPSKETNV